jgi:hypothetical protein
MVVVLVLVIVVVLVAAHAVANNTTHIAATVKIDQVPFFMFVPPNSYRILYSLYI